MRIGICNGCHRRGIWVNIALYGNVVRGEFCGDCFESRFGIGRRREASRTKGRAAPEHDEPSPWQENAVRELEDALAG